METNIILGSIIVGLLIAIYFKLSNIEDKLDK